MQRAVFPDPVANLNHLYDEESPRNTSETTIVRAFTESFQQDEDEESPTTARVGPNDSTNNTTASNIQTENDTGSQNTSERNITDSTNSILPTYRPSFIAVTATPAQDLGYLVGFESTPYGIWRTPIHYICCQIYPTCICSTFCPFLVISQLNQKLRQRSFYSTLLYFSFGLIFIIVGTYLFKSPFVISLCVFPIVYYAFHLRQQVRKQFKLPGSAVSDFFFSCCFPTLVIAQISRHIYNYPAPFVHVPITSDGSKEGPEPIVSSGRAILRGAIPPSRLPVVEAAPRHHLVHPEIQTPPRNVSRQSQPTGAVTPPIYVNISYTAQMTPSVSRFNEDTNTQQHIAIPVGQTPCAVTAVD